MRLLILTWCLVATAYAAEKTDREMCFPGVLFAQNQTVLITLANEGKRPRDTTIQRYSGTGKVLDTLTRNVAPGVSTDVRLSVESDWPEIGWIRVLDSGKDDSLRVTLTRETLSGNALTSVASSPIFRFPGSETVVRKARQHSTTLKATLDDADTFAYVFFVNLSNYPLEIGMCQAGHSDCTNATLPYTVLPMGQKGFPVDRQKKFLVLESSPGYFCTTGLALVDGLRQSFGAASSITFSQPRSDTPEVDDTSPAASPIPLANAGRVQTPSPVGNFQELLANNETAKASQAVAAGGPARTPDELAAMIEKGQASKCAVLTIPPGAEIKIDDNRLGISPISFVLVKHGETPRTITVTLTGYKTVKKQVIPDGKPIPIVLTLENSE